MAAKKKYLVGRDEVYSWFTRKDEISIEDHEVSKELWEELKQTEKKLFKLQNEIERKFQRQIDRRIANESKN